MGTEHDQQREDASQYKVRPEMYRAVRDARSALEAWERKSAPESTTHEELARTHAALRTAVEGERNSGLLPTTEEMEEPMRLLRRMESHLGVDPSGDSGRA